MFIVIERKALSVRACVPNAIGQNSSGSKKLTSEATGVDRTQQLEKSDSVFWEFGKVLVDHGKSGFKD
jgi:hypothetical protein